MLDLVQREDQLPQNLCRDSLGRCLLPAQPSGSEQGPCYKCPQHLPEKAVGMNCPTLTPKAKGAKEGSLLPSSQWDLQMRGTSLPGLSITGG